MTKTLVFIIMLGIFLIGCDSHIGSSRYFEESVKEARNKDVINKLGLLADSTFTDSYDLNAIFNFKTIDLNGKITTVEMNRSIELYIENLNKNSPDLFPIYEVKKSSLVILALNGQGMWDKIWSLVALDKNTLEINHLELDHKGETPGLGSRINDLTFRAQFIGTVINLDSNSYALSNDKKNYARIQIVDGLSGATITSQGAIDMLNKDILKYKNYLR